jgi:hypothetical protein
METLAVTVEEERQLRLTTLAVVPVVALVALL